MRATTGSTGLLPSWKSPPAAQYPAPVHAVASSPVLGAALVLAGGMISVAWVSAKALTTRAGTGACAGADGSTNTSAPKAPLIAARNQ